MSKARVIRCFFGTDMRNAHEGLRKIAKKENINVDALESGEFIIFINTKKDRLKMYAADSTVAYHYKPGQHIDLRAIANIPKVFSGTGRLDYDAALRETLEKVLWRKS